MKEYSAHPDLEGWYNALAERWQAYYVAGTGHFTNRIKNVHLLLSDLGPESEVLDIGCGTGEITASIHKRFGCRTTGIDFAGNMVVRCRKTHHIEGLQFEVGDIRNLPFPEEQFDLVLSMSVIEWVEDYTRCISEVSRVLKPRGQWIVSIPNWASLTRRIERLKSLISSQSYLRLQKNRVPVTEFRGVSLRCGLETVKTLYHVTPWWHGNLPGSLGRLLGAMCILSMKKT